MNGERERAQVLSFIDLNFRYVKNLSLLYCNLELKQWCQLLNCK